MNLKPIRVLMIIGSLGDGGKERQLLLLLKTLKKHEDFLSCLVIINPGGEREKEASQLADKLVVLSDKRNINLIRPLVKLIRLIKVNQIDIIQTWGSGLWDLIGLLAGRWCKIPVIHNGIRSAPNRLNFYNQVTRLTALFADVAVANSNAGIRAFKLEKHQKAKVIYNGLDPSRFDDVDIIEIGQNLCMVANFRQEKDHRSLVLAMPDILEKFPDTQLILVGHDYGTFSEIKDLVDELGIVDHITFMTDCTHPEPIIGSCQIGILTTDETVHGEGTPNAVLEYMALGKPAIVSNNGGNPEVVVDRVTGYIVQPRSPRAISEKVIYLLENPTIARQMGANAKFAVNQRFTQEKMEKEFINLFREVQSGG